MTSKSARGSWRAAKLPTRSAKRAVRALCLVFAALAAGGCLLTPPTEGDDEEQEPPPTQEELLLEEYPLLASHVICDLPNRCCNELSQEFWNAGGDEADCVIFFGLNFAGQVGEIMGSLTTGRALYHNEAVRTCMESLQTTTCGALAQATIAPGCEAPWFTPLVPLGGDCRLTIDCIDSYCEGSTHDDSSEFAHGTCVDLLPNGAACAEAAQCQSGYCSDDECGSQPDEDVISQVCIFG